MRYFYNVYSELSLKSQQEYRANIATIKKLVPRDELIEAIHAGLFEHWELSEYFEVSDEFMVKAMEYYGKDIA